MNITQMQDEQRVLEARHTAIIDQKAAAQTELDKAQNRVNDGDVQAIGSAATARNKIAVLQEAAAALDAKIHDVREQIAAAAVQTRRNDLIAEIKSHAEHAKTMQETITEQLALADSALVAAVRRVLETEAQIADNRKACASLFAELAGIETHQFEHSIYFSHEVQDKRASGFDELRRGGVEANELWPREEAALRDGLSYGLAIFAAIDAARRHNAPRVVSASIYGMDNSMNEPGVELPSDVAMRGVLRVRP